MPKSTGSKTKIRYVAEWMLPEASDAIGDDEVIATRICRSLDEAKRVAMERGMKAGACDHAAVEEQHYSKARGWHTVLRIVGNWTGKWETDG